jgi:hypothetical protein
MQTLYIYVSKDVIIFQSQNRSTSKQVWETLVRNVTECRFPQQPHFKNKGRKFANNYRTGITPITTDGFVTLKISIKLYMQMSVGRPCQQIQK